MRRQPRAVRTITAGNVRAFNRDKALEARVPLKCSFATPHHARERGSNENTNGLIRQCLPTGVNMEHLTQADVDHIADKRNRQPRKRHTWRTPKERHDT